MCFRPDLYYASYYVVKQSRFEMLLKRLDYQLGQALLSLKLNTCGWYDSKNVVRKRHNKRDIRIVLDVSCFFQHRSSYQIYTKGFSARRYCIDYSNGMRLTFWSYGSKDSKILSTQQLFHVSKCERGNDVSFHVFSSSKSQWFSG